jgi:hypothetical protein
MVDSIRIEDKLKQYVKEHFYAEYLEGLKSNNFQVLHFFRVYSD